MHGCGCVSLLTQAHPCPSFGVSLSRWGLLLRLVQIPTCGLSVPGWIPARAECVYPVGICTNLAGVSLLVQGLLVGVPGLWCDDGVSLLARGAYPDCGPVVKKGGGVSLLAQGEPANI